MRQRNCPRGGFKLCQFWQQEMNFLSFLRWPDDLTVTLYVSLWLGGSMPYHFSSTSPSLKRIFAYKRNQKLIFSSSFCDMSSLLPQTSLHTSRRTFETSAGATSEGSCSTGDSARCQQQHWHTNPRGGFKWCAGKVIPLFTPQVKNPYFLLNADYWTKMSLLLGQSTT